MFIGTERSNNEPRRGGMCRVGAGIGSASTGTFHSYGARVHGAFGLYKHFTPTGFVLVPLRFYKHFISTGLKVATTLLVVASITFGSISAWNKQPQGHK